MRKIPDSRLPLTILFEPKLGGDRCYRIQDDVMGDWICVNDITSCQYNTGHNICVADGDDESPLEGD